MMFEIRKFRSTVLAILPCNSCPETDGEWDIKIYSSTGSRVVLINGNGVVLFESYGGMIRHELEAGRSYRLAVNVDGKEEDVSVSVIISRVAE